MVDVNLQSIKEDLETEVRNIASGLTRICSYVYTSFEHLSWQDNDMELMKLELEKLKEEVENLKHQNN